MATTLTLGNRTANPYSSIPTTGNPGNLPTPPAFTKIGRILRDRILRSRYPALTPPTTSIARQQEIENALSMALHYVRTADTQQGIQAATAKAIRAVSMLKQACTESTIGGRAAA